jgi:hypothetical protein
LQTWRYSHAKIRLFSHFLSPRFADIANCRVNGKPARAEISAHVEWLGRSPMTVAVDVTAETLVTDERRLAIRGRFEMVAVDGCGRPTAIAEAKDGPA